MGLEIYRSSGQALFKYLPECVIEASGGMAVTKVARWRGLPFKPQGIERILDEIQNVARPIAVGGAYLNIDRRFPTTYSVKNFEFYRPDSIELELFPLTFYSRNDNRYTEFTNVDSVKRFFSRLGVEEQRNWVQADLVYVNPKTSNVKSFHVVPCRTHMNNKTMMLDKKGKGSQRDWKWRCTICNTEYTVGGYVDGDYIFTASPVRSPVVFQPQILSMVNVRDRSKVKVGKNDASLIILAKYLDKIPGSLDEIFEDVGREKKSGLTQRTMENSIADLKGKGFTNDQIKIISETWSREAVKASSDLDSALGETQRLVSSLDTQRISYRIYEYLETLSEQTKTTLDDISNTNSALSVQIEMFKDKLKNIGVTRSYALEKVPIIQVAYGYIRGDLNASKCMLKAFPNEKDPENIPLYANDIETEALLLEFDRKRVGEWLKANGVIKHWEPKNEQEEKTWFLNNVDQSLITRFEGVKDSATRGSSITNAVFTLLHTMSHALIKQIPLHSGISTNSLGEIIFPNIPAILIFSNSQGGFNIGELHELYENRTYPWIDNVKDASSHCVYDPVCFEQDGACHYCMFLHEVTCAHFNKALGRDYLFSGGKHNLRFGFWDFDKW